MSNLEKIIKGSQRYKDKNETELQIMQCKNLLRNPLQLYILKSTYSVRCLAKLKKILGQVASKNKTHEKKIYTDLQKP